MPGAFRRSSNPDTVMGPQPPPVAPRSGAAKVTVQAWQSSAPPKIVDTSADDASSYGHHVRCGSLDSVDSNSGSSTSSSSSHTRQLSHDGEYLPTRTTVKTPSLPPHNPLQFVKINSPLYKKAESQIKLAKEVKITKEALKESEEEWQSNLDNWKSRRRKVSEKVIQRAEEMRQIEAEEQLRQLKEQQRKIKTFSEMVEKRSTKRSYNLDLYISQGDDSGVGGTPEPEENDGVDGQQLNIRSDTSEGMTSETESIDSDAHMSEKPNKEPPKVPKKPASWLARKNSSDYILQPTSSPTDMLHHSYIAKDGLNSENAPSSSEPSDVEGHNADLETASSEDDAGFCGTGANVDSGLESLCDSHRPNDTADSASDLSQDSSAGTDKVGQENEVDFVTSSVPPERPRRRGQLSKEKSIQFDEMECEKDGIRISISTNHGHDSKGFGFSFRGGKNEGSEVTVDNIVQGGAADLAGLKIGDKILLMNGEPTLSYSHSSLLFSVKQASYTGHLDLLVQRTSDQDVPVIGKKFDKKGASFAEKLAIFSGSSPNSTLAKPSSQVSKLSREEEIKRESLVLRRRTTFERSSAEKEEMKSRRSSCVSPETTSRSLMEERRHSVDFSRSSEKPAPDSGSSSSATKKPPPPPIPAKPKVKPKTYHQSPVFTKPLENVTSVDAYNSDRIALRNRKNEDYLRELNDDIDDNYTVIYSSKASSSITDAQEAFNGSQNGERPAEEAIDETDYPSRSRSRLERSPSGSQNDFDTLARKEIAELRRLSLEEIAATASIQPEVTDGRNGELVSSPDVDNVNNEVFSAADDEFQFEDLPKDVEEDEIGKSSNALLEASCDQSESELALEDRKTCSPYQLAKTFEFPEQAVVEEEVERREQSPPSPPVEEEVDIDENDLCDQDAVRNDGGDTAEDREEDDDAGRMSTMVEHSFADEVTDGDEISAVSREHFVQISVHPLGMPLEKIDEDDVVSGSTNSSSTDTPDTETVIDIFPLDIPPLPCDDAVVDLPPSSYNTHPVDEYEDRQLYDIQPTSREEEEAGVEPEEVARSPREDYSLPNGDELLEKELGSGCQQLYEDENELAESADQLSPLDVIDQMELRLMQELEQQALEDYSEESNEQLEEEVSRQLMYLSDDADFIDDLDVPRNVVPPSEPPPPPPPEPEKVLDSKVNPFQRVNSTKRIKKEIWRRRSDFLGLDSPSGISVDDLPPPPPGLEELLKSEMEMQREQRLYLEKHLSLADSDYASASETLNSMTDSTTFSPSKEYTSEYMMEVLDSEVFDAVPADYSQSETWKDEECQSPTPDSEIQEPDVERENCKQVESAQQKAKSHIHSLGAAPRAKIMDSNKWITQAEKHAPLAKRTTVDPLFRDGSYNQNFWLTQEADRRVSVVETSRPAVDRRYSMPPVYGSKAPDVTVRTWSDRESEYQQQSRPKSGAWPASGSSVAQNYPTSNYPDYYSNRSSSWTESTNGFEEEKEQCDASHQCSCCGQALTEGSAMGIDALQLYFHIECFRCCVCQLQLGNGSCGTDVQVKNSQLYCPKCFALD